MHMVNESRLIRPNLLNCLPLRSVDYGSLLLLLRLT